MLRATDFRGILMRVVLDARTGAIRDVTRIVPATSGPIGMMPPSYWPVPPAYGSPAYGSPAEFGAPTGMGPGGAPGQLSQPALPSATAPARPQFPPLPRPRPTEQASQKPDSGTVTSAVLCPRPASTAPPNERVQVRSDSDGARYAIRRDSNRAAASPAARAKRRQFRRSTIDRSAPAPHRRDVRENRKRSGIPERSLQEVQIFRNPAVGAYAACFWSSITLRWRR